MNEKGSREMTGGGGGGQIPRNNSREQRKKEERANIKRDFAETFLTFR